MSSTAAISNFPKPKLEKKASLAGSNPINRPPGSIGAVLHPLAKPFSRGAIPHKAATILYGKKQNKIYDRLGVSEREFAVANSVSQKAIQQLGMFQLPHSNADDTAEARLARAQARINVQNERKFNIISSMNANNNYNNGYSGGTNNQANSTASGRKIHPVEASLSPLAVDSHPAPHKASDLLYGGHKSAPGKQFDKLGVSPQEVSKFSSAQKAYQHLGVASQNHSLSASAAAEVSHNNHQTSLSNADESESSNDVEMSQMRANKKAQDVLFGGNKSEGKENKLYDKLGLAPKEFEKFHDKPPKLISQLGINNHNRANSSLSEDVLAQMTQHSSAESSEAHQNLRHRRSASQDSIHSTASSGSQHLVIPGKAQDVLYGGHKSTNKMRDKLGVSLAEVERYEQAPRAYQKLGIYEENLVNSGRKTRIVANQEENAENNGQTGPKPRKSSQKGLNNSGSAPSLAVLKVNNRLKSNSPHENAQVPNNADSQGSSSGNKPKLHRQTTSITTHNYDLNVSDAVIDRLSRHKQAKSQNLMPAAGPGTDSSNNSSESNPNGTAQHGSVTQSLPQQQNNKVLLPKLSTSPMKSITSPNNNNNNDHIIINNNGNNNGSSNMNNSVDFTSQLSVMNSLSDSLITDSKIELNFSPVSRSSQVLRSSSPSFDSASAGFASLSPSLPARSRLAAEISATESAVLAFEKRAKERSLSIKFSAQGLPQQLKRPLSRMPGAQSATPITQALQGQKMANLVSNLLAQKKAVNSITNNHAGNSPPKLTRQGTLKQNCLANSGSLAINSLGNNAGGLAIVALGKSTGTATPLNELADSSSSRVPLGSAHPSSIMTIAKNKFLNKSSLNRKPSSGENIEGSSGNNNNNNYSTLGGRAASDNSNSDSGAVPGSSQLNQRPVLIKTKTLSIAARTTLSALASNANHHNNSNVTAATSSPAKLISFAAPSSFQSSPAQPPRNFNRAKTLMK
jgi:hypothetical protein